MNKSVLYKLFLLCGFFLTLFFGVAQAEDVRFQQGIEAYNQGQYEQAIEKFQSLAEEGISASLLYNLANSYAQNGQSGMAILYYERAARLAPGDSDIQGNLELLRKEKTLFQEEQSFSQRFVHLFGLDRWTILLLASVLLFAAVLLFPATPKLKNSTRTMVATSSLLIILASVFGIVGQYRHYHDGVVIVDDVRLRISPFDSAAAGGSIQEGRLLTPLKTHNNYTLIRDEAGRKGWLAADEFLYIVE